MSRMVSFFILVAIIAVFGVLFFRVMSSFLLPLFLAALLVVVFRPVHLWMLSKCKGRQHLAAGLTTASILLIVLIPLGWILSLAVMEGVQLATTGFRATNEVERRVKQLRKRFQLDIPHAPLLERMEVRFSTLKSETIGDKDREQLEEVLLQLKTDVKVLTEERSVQERIRTVEEMFRGKPPWTARLASAKSELEQIDLDKTDEGTVPNHKQTEQTLQRLHELNNAVARMALEYVRRRFSGSRQQIDASADKSEQWNEIAEQLNTIEASMTAQEESLSGNTSDDRALEQLVELNSRVERLVSEVQGGAVSEKLKDLADARRSRRSLGSDSLIESLEDLQTRIETNEPPIVPGDADYQSMLEKAELAYHGFRQRLLGGPMLAWLVELANPSDLELRSWQSNAVNYLKGWLLSVTGATTARIGSALLGLGIMTVGMYYFFKDGPSMITAFMRLSPLDDRYERELLGEFDSVSRAVVLATLLSAVAQGLLAGIAYFFADLGSVFLLTMLTMLFAMIPFVGAAAIWVPACLWLAFIDQRTVAAMILAVYGAGVVSMADNVIKPFVLHGQSNLHPLLALLSVLGGVQALGPIGILVGPMVVSFLQALLNMLNTELATMERQSAADKT